MKLTRRELLKLGAAVTGGALLAVTGNMVAENMEEAPTSEPETVEVTMKVSDIQNDDETRTMIRKISRAMARSARKQIEREVWS